jgi:hypothetical protein
MLVRTGKKVNLDVTYYISGIGAQSKGSIPNPSRNKEVPRVATCVPTWNSLETYSVPDE